MIDIHCHILPGLDDGAQSLEEALQMARVAVHHGIHTIMATPHHANGVYENDAARVMKSVRKLNAALREHQLPLTVLPGQEYRVNAQLLEELDNRLLLPLNHSRYVLLELPSHYVPDRIYELFYELRLRDKVAIIAHPERNGGFIRNPQQIREVIEHGGLLQLTAASLLGKHGKTIQKMSMAWCRQGWVHFIASDAHNQIRSIDHLSAAYRWIELRLGKSYADLYRHNAVCVQEDAFISPRSGRATVRAGRSWTSWFKFWG